MLFVFFEFDLLCQIIKDSVHPYPGEALLPGILKDLQVFTLFTPDHRGQYHKTGALAQGFHPVHNLVDGLTGNLLAAFGAVGNAHPSPKQTQIIVNLRNGTHSRPRVFGGGLLINGNGGRQSVNGVHIRLVHLPQKLPGIAGKALHISSLAFRINGIKGKA